MAERLENRTVLNASVSIDAGGLATIRLDELTPTRLDISTTGGEYTFATPSSGFFTVDLAENAAGLPTSGEGTYAFHVSGITGLTIDVESYSNVVLVSSDVPTTIHIQYQTASVLLGGGYGTNGLKDVSAPVVVDVSGLEVRDPWFRKSLFLVDSGSSEAATYTITADTVDATGGFGGLTYSGIDDLSIEGPEASTGTTRFDVQSTHAGGTWLSARGSENVVFDVDATVTPDDRPPLAPWAVYDPLAGDGRMNLTGGGTTTYNIKKTPTPVTIFPVSTRNTVNLTNDGTTSGIAHDVSIGPFVGRGNTIDPWYADIVLDDSAGTLARDASFYSDLNGVRNSTFAGVAGDGARILLSQNFAGNVVYKAPKGLGNALAVDLAGLKRSPGTLTYDAGSSGEADPESRLTRMA